MYQIFHIFLNDFKIFFKYMMFTFLFYFIGIFAILRANVLYVDDMGRTLENYFGWTSVGRPLADILSEFCFFFPTDISPVTQLLGILILAYSSVIVVSIFSCRITYSRLFASTLIGLSPYYLENLSYKYDSLYMSLAICLALLPLYINRKKIGDIHKIVFSSLCLTGTLCLYQSALGVYTAGILLYFLYVINMSKKSVINILKRCKNYLMPLFISLILYKIILLSINLSQYAKDLSETVSIFQMPHVIANNIANYIRILFHDWQNKIGILACCIILLFLINMLILMVTKKTNKTKLFVSIISVFFLLVISYGPSIVLQTISWNPRTFIGIGVVMACLMVINSNFKATKFVNTIVSALLVFYIISFSSSYGNLLYLQKKQEDTILNFVLYDLKSLSKPKTTVPLYIRGRLPYTPYLNNISVKYPLMQRLIPIHMQNSWWWGFVQLRSYGVHVENTYTSNIKHHLNKIENPYYILSHDEKSIILEFL